MDYVYVVTVSARGAGVGEFGGATPPRAFEDQIAAAVLAFQCREALGGRWAQVDAAGSDVDDPEDYIVERWDSDEFSVWVERLVFEAAQ